MDESLLLAYDSLASFLRDLDDAGEPFVCPPVSSGGQSDSCDSPSSLSEAVALPKPRRRRPKATEGAPRSVKAKHNDRVRKLRNEIQVLYRQLKRLQLDPNGSPGVKGASWKQRAISQRLSRDRAEYDNEYLKQRLVEGMKLREEVKRLLVKQQEMLPRRFIRVQYSLVDDDSHAFGLLRANLSKRQHQMEISMQSKVIQITQQCLSGQFRQADAPWSLVAHGKSLRLEMEESGLVPFNAAIVNAAIRQYTQSGTIQVAGDNVVDRVLWGTMSDDVELNFSLDTVSGGRELKGRSILRRIRNDFGMVILWEAMGTWQREGASEESPHVIVTESGCSFTVAAGDDAEDMSVGYSARSFRIQSSDGSSLEARNPLVRKIAHVCQELHKLHSRRMGNIVMDRSIASQRQTESVKPNCHVLEIHNER